MTDDKSSSPNPLPSWAPPDLASLDTRQLRDYLEQADLRRRAHKAQRAELRREARQRNPIRAPFKQVVRAGIFFITHALLAALAIALLTLISGLLRWMGSPELFGRVPVSYIFDAMDLMILVVFGVFGTMEAIAVFRE